MPYEPGTHDCALFVADCVEAMTAVDLAADYRGRYTTIAGALIALKRAGFDDVMAIVASRLTEIVPVSRAVFGDIGAVPTDDDIGWNFGLVNGERVIVLRPEGLGSVPRSWMTRAFRV